MTGGCGPLPGSQLHAYVARHSVGFMVELRDAGAVLLDALSSPQMRAVDAVVLVDLHEVRQHAAQSMGGNDRQGWVQDSSPRPGL